MLVGIPFALIAIFVTLTWESETFRRGIARFAPYLQLLLYAAAAGALVVVVLRRWKGSSASPAPLVRCAERGMRWGAWPFGLAGAVIAYIVPIVEAWQTGRGGDHALAGAIPWIDARGYQLGAERLLFLGDLDFWNSARPPNTASLALGLFATGHDLRMTLVLRAILLGVACFLAARAVARDFGVIAGLVMFAGIYSFTSFSIESTMTETLGVTFGVLAFTALWHGVRDHSVWLAVAGLFILTLALDTRAGPVFLLVALPVWFSYHFHGRGRWNVRVLGIGIGAVVAGLLANIWLVVALGGAPGNVNASGYYALYGLARGNEGWAVIHKDFPRLARLPQDEQTSFVREKFFAQVEDDPALFAKGLYLSGRQYLQAAHNQVVDPVRSSSFLRYAFYVVLASLGALVLVRRWRTTRWRSLLDLGLFGGVVLAAPVMFLLWSGDGLHYPSWLAFATVIVAFAAYGLVGSARIKSPLWSLAAVGILGLAVSIPFLPLRDGGARVFAASVPFFVLPVAGAVALLHRAAVDARASERALAPGPERPWWSVGLAGAVAAAIFVGTPILALASSKPEAAARECPDGRAAHAYTGGVAVHLVAANDKDQVDELERGRLELRDYFVINQSLAGLRAGDTILAAYNVKDRADASVLEGFRKQSSLVFVDGDVEAPEGDVLYLCGRVRNDPAIGIPILFAKPLDP